MKPSASPGFGFLHKLAASGIAVLVACTGGTVDGNPYGPPTGSGGGGPIGAGAGAGAPGSAGGAIASGGGSANPAGGSAGATASIPPFEPAPGMLRRLTRAQFGNALRDLLGVEVNTSEIAPDSWDGDFAVIGASTVVTSENGVEQYHAAIEGALNTRVRRQYEASAASRLHTHRGQHRCLPSRIFEHAWVAARGGVRSKRSRSTNWPPSPRSLPPR